MASLMACFVVILLTAVFLPTADSECGNPEVKPEVRLTRIVGGNEAVPNSWPWQAALYEKKFLFIYLQICGGALIHPDWLLTSAHCVRNKKANELKVKLGAHNTGIGYFRNIFELRTQQEMGIQEIHVHPDYNTDTYTHDLSLLKLKSPAKLTKYVQPVCLPTRNCTFETGEKGVVTGWGSTRDGSSGTVFKLRQAVQPIVDPQQCATTYRGVVKVDDSMLCAGTGDGDKDSCQGDSGGPLVVSRDGRWLLGGLVSFGVGCGKKGFPGVYTRTAPFTDWISQTTGLEPSSFM